MEEEQINSYLTFKIGEELYGVHVEQVSEILEYKEPETRTSNLPYLLGLVDHRGSIIPLIDTSIKFGGQAIQTDDKVCLLVLNIKNNDETFEVALIVNEIFDVLTIEEAEKSHIETNYKPGYVQFAVKREDMFMLVIDANKVFGDMEIVEMKKFSGK